MQVLSSLSSIPFYAPSAGHAPTNSADVSAIASAYQVVSSTATQLYAGTAYLTSVNDNPLSASRAGQAANASMATSAYYDGTGRLISALPDSATVSAIASSYAESAASGKLDKTAQVVTAIGTGWNSDDDEIVSAVNGCILSADEARYARTADGSNYARYDRRTNVTGYRTISSLPGSAEVSAIASSYAESAASSKLDSSASSSFYGIDNPSGFLTAAYTPTFGYNTADQISSIDGSALGGMDEAAVSGIASAYAESAVSAASSNYYTTANESGFLTAQVQASWSESASASPSYIQDKPDLVDIVAGPGIVVDNPDGNTLRVSMAQDYETLLWSGDAISGNISLSEPRTNFSRLCFVTQDSTGYNHINYCDASAEYVSNTIVTHYPGSANSMILKFSHMSATSPSSYNIFNYGRAVFSLAQVVDITTSTNAPHCMRIYGINRTASAQ